MNNPRYIILHHSLTKDSETVSWQAIRKYHVDKLKWRDIGYHNGIEMVNDRHEILVGRMMNDSGAHCRQLGMNRLSFGICCVGNFDLEKPPEEMWFMALDLCRTYMDMFNIPRANVKGHRELANYKTCPGIMWGMGKFRDQL